MCSAPPVAPVITSVKAQIWKQAVDAQSGCPPADRWAGWLAHALPPSEWEEMGRHLRECPRCDAEVALLENFLTAVPEANEAAAVRWVAARLRKRPESPLSGWRQWLGGPFPLRMWAYAAVLLLAAGAVLESRRPSAPGLDPVAAETFRSIGSIEWLSGEGDLAERPVSLRWRAVEGASRYSVRVFEVDDQVAWQGQATRAQLTLPADAAGMLAPRKTLLVQVQALGPAGQLIAETAKIRMRYHPGGK